MADNEDIPFNRDFPAEARRGRGGPARRAARALQQSEPVHLHRHGQLHRRHAARSRSSIPARTMRPMRRRCSTRCAARRSRISSSPTPTSDHSPNTRAHQGRHRREGLCRRSASRFAAALREREAQAGSRRRPRLQAGYRSEARRRRRGRRLGAGSGGDAGPRRQSHGVRLAGAKDQFRRRSRDGLVDLDRRAAGRLDDRLHGLAGKAGAARRGSVFLRPRSGDSGRPALRALPAAASPGARGLDPASARQGRGRYPDHGARDLYRHRSAAVRRGRLFGAGASGGSGRRAAWWRPTAIR